MAGHDRAAHAPLMTRVFHMLPETYALNDLRDRRLKVSVIEDMNDPFELLAVSMPKPNHREILKRAKADLDRLLGALCFSRRWKDPVLWSHYADKHRGICLGFDVPEDKAIPITYVAKRIDVDVDQQLSASKRDLDLGLKLMTTKYRGWEYEDELRVVVSLYRETSFDGRFHFFAFGHELRLREVIVGARSLLCRQDIIAAIDPADRRKVRLTKARLAFETYTVVEQQNPKLWC